MFFKDIIDFQKYVSVNKSLSFTDITLYLRDVDRNILKKFLGADFLAELQALYNASITESPTQLTGKPAEAIEMIRQSTAVYALAKWVPFGQLSIDDAGIRIANTEHFKTAFQWQIEDLVKALNNNATGSFDDLLIYLEKNSADFSTYKNSDEFKENNSLFISTSTAFSKEYSAFANSPSQFYKLRSIIKKTELFDLKPVLLPEFFNELKTMLSNAGVDESASVLLPIIRPALAHLTIARAVNELAAEFTADGFLIFDNTGGRDTIKNKKQAGNELIRIAEQAKRDGDAYLSILAEFLEANKNSYPSYLSSTSYIDPTATTDTTSSTDKEFYSAL